MRDRCSLKEATEPTCVAAAGSRQQGALRRLLLVVVCAIMVAGCGSSEGQATQLLGSQAEPRQTTSAAQVGGPRDAGLATAIPSLGKAVVVHIPSFELIALEDGAPVLRSRVIVGRPATPTPELLSSMSSIRFNRPGCQPHQ
jgi:hypothetical protein